MANGLSRDELGPLRALWDVGTLSGLDDRALLARFVGRGDEGAGLAFEVLIRRHGPMVFRVCSQLVDGRHAAEDAFQAVFLVLARRAGSIRRPEKLAPWLHGVALRTAKESRSRDIARRRLERRGASMPPTRSDLPESPMILAEEAEILHREIARLPGRYRDLVVLCDLEGLTQQEAATRLRCPLGTVAIRLKRAKERLRDRLTRRGVAPTAAWMTSAIGSPGNVPPISYQLVVATVRTSTAAGAASASVMSLAQGVQMTMTISRGKAIAATAVLALGLATTLGVAAGVQAPSPRPDVPPSAIPIRSTETAVLRQIRDHEDYLGRTEPSRIEEVRARVGGIVLKVPVEYGGRVKAGDLLFEIEPKPFQAALELAESQVRKSAARRALATSVVLRNKKLAQKGANLVSSGELEKGEAELIQSDEELRGANQDEERAKADLAATRIVASSEGELVRRPARPVELAQAGHSSLMTLARVTNVGDAIKAGESALAKIVSIDPMVVGFDVDETTILRLRRMYGDDKAKAAEALTIRVALLDEEAFTREAKLESLPARLDQQTATGRFRATIPNPDGFILPGMVARVRIATSPPREALVVPESALGKGENGATLSVVGDRDVVEERVVRLGGLHDGFREIREGLKPGDRVLTGDKKGIEPGKPRLESVP